MPMSRPLSLIEPYRLRFVPPSFAWIDRRLRQHSLLAVLSADEIALYVFLVLAADREGLSCWRVDRMERELPLSSAEQVLSIETRATLAARRGGVRTMSDVLDDAIRTERR